MRSQQGPRDLFTKSQNHRVKYPNGLSPLSSGPHCLCGRRNHPNSARRRPSADEEGLMLCLVFAPVSCAGSDTRVQDQGPIGHGNSIQEAWPCNQTQSSRRALNADPKWRRTSIRREATPSLCHQATIASLCCQFLHRPLPLSLPGGRTDVSAVQVWLKL